MNLSSSALNLMQMLYVSVLIMLDELREEFAQFAKEDNVQDMMTTIKLCLVYRRFLVSVWTMWSVNRLSFSFSSART